MIILETDRLKIRRFSSDDWKDLYEYLSKEQVIRFEPYNIYSEEDCSRILPSALKAGF